MKYFLLTAALLCSSTIVAQKKELKDSIDHQLILKTGALISSDERAPFWISANNSQRFTPDESSTTYSNLFLFKTSNPKRELDYHYGLEALMNFDGSINTKLIQSYIGLSNKWLNLTVGRKEEIFGLNHIAYGFGNLINGNNALPVPKVSISTNGWIKAPLLKDYVSYKAYLAHGWFEKNRFQSGAFLHQKYFYLNIHPKSNWFELSFGLTHNAQWGGQNLDSELKQPAGFKSYTKIFLASNGGKDAQQTDQINALGNHLGTWDLQGKINFENWSLSNYWQFLWEDRSGLTPFNWRDGKVGITIEHKNKKSIISTFNLEIVRTNDQDAEKVGDNGISFLEPDDFLNNSVYRSGWTYKNTVIGSPIFLLLNENPATSSSIKNMVNAVSLSVAGQIMGLDYAISYRDFSNGGTRYESIDPKLKVKSMMLTVGLQQGNSKALIQAEYDWGNYLGRNLGFKIEYQFNLSALLRR